MKKQVIFIGWWVAKENYKSYYDFLEKVEYNPFYKNFLNYNKTLWKNLGKNYDFIHINMPNKDFADYNAWKIIFEKTFPFLDKNIILISTSLGSSFLLKYLSENNFPKKIEKLFLLAPAIKDSKNELLGTFNFDFEKLKKIEKIAEKIYIYHSLDDKIVDFSNSLELKKYLNIDFFRKFKKRWHFYDSKRILRLENDIKN